MNVRLMFVAALVIVATETSAQDRIGNRSNPERGGSNTQDRLGSSQDRLDRQSGTQDRLDRQSGAQDRLGGGAARSAAGPGPLKTLRERASYSFGMAMGGSLKKQAVDVDINLLIQGLKDASGSGKTILTEEQAFEAMQEFEKDVASKQAEESKRFLVENKKRQGVKSTSSGLQYKVLKAGKPGMKPKSDDVVSVNYRAMFVNGTEFENNGAKPFVTPLANVIPGWQEALQLMDVGSKWQLFVPSELGYGEQGQPPAIGPNVTLVFEVELVGINKPNPGTAAKPRKPAVE